MDLKRVINVEDLRTIARARLPRFIFDYVDGGAEDEVTLEANRESFERLRLRPRTLVDVSNRSLGTTILGAPAAMPVVAGPVGLLGFVWPDGDAQMARAAAAAGIPCGVSTVSTQPLEEVAREAGGRLWFQCYVLRQRPDVTDALIRRAAAAGYETLIITSDFPVSGKRERDLRSGLLPSRRLTLASKIDILAHPRWVMTVARRRPSFVNIERELGPGHDAASFVPLNMFEPALDWDAFRRFRDQWKGRLLLKGVLRADDAARAVECGADGVVLSNHGGRQLDSAVTGLAVLPEVVREIGGRASIIVDGGVRRGSDIAKAVACGAEAVILGRAVTYGLAAGGAAGVSRALDILRDELDRTLALTGCRSIADVTRDLIATA